MIQLTKDNDLKAKTELRRSYDHTVFRNWNIENCTFWSKEEEHAVASSMRVGGVKYGLRKTGSNSKGRNFFTGKE